MKHDCTAPAFKDILPMGAQNVQACWHYTDDGVQIRSLFWPRPGARGVVYILTGRTEYAEKYGDVAAALVDAGLNVVAIDWRGQGLSQRLLDDPKKGHVGDFWDYQKDLTTVRAFFDQLLKPQPVFMLAHSMGGAIGLRALMQGFDVQAACFSAPMWGIELAPPLTTVAQVLGWGLGMVGADDAYVPSAGPTPYLESQAFEGNTLTDHAPTYARLQDQLRAHPELGLGGPTVRWLNLALDETDALAQMPAPAVPCLTLMGEDEAIVRKDRIISRMEHWPQGRLLRLPGKRHEMLMSDPATQSRLIGDMLDLFTPSV